MQPLQKRLANIRVVLVEPRYDGNLGQIARAMRNFGLTRMFIAGGSADPRAPEARWYSREEGADVLDRAVKVDTLDQAVAGCGLLIGTTRRAGKGRTPGEAPEALLAELAPWDHPGDVGLLFGREAHGLFNHELERCQRVLSIPTDDACPSLNLSHAVVVTAFALAAAAEAAGGRARETLSITPAPAEELEAMFQHARRAWQRIGYLKAQNPDAVLRRWRRIFGRSLLDAHEVAMIRGLLHQTEWLAGVAGIPPGGPAEAPASVFDKHRATPGSTAGAAPDGDEE